MARNQAVIKAVEIKDIRSFDKLLSDIIGREEKVLIPRGTTISAREIKFLKDVLAHGKPQLASQKYRTKLKSIGNIVSASGTVLVKRGEEVTEEKLAPLLKEGFAVQETFESEQKMFYKKATFEGPWHITDFNPLVQVERTELVNDDGSPLKPAAAAGK